MFAVGSVTIMKSFSTSAALQTQLLLVLALTFLNLVLLLVNIGTISIPEKSVKKELVVEKEEKLQEIKVGEEVQKAGYKIKLENPRYEFDEEFLFDSFKLNAAVTNQSVKPALMPIFNCDIADGGKVVITGSGVILNESHELTPGENHEYTVTVNLEEDYTKEGQTYSKDDGTLFPGRRVVSCRFTPTGSYDPEISVEVRFD